MPAPIRLQDYGVGIFDLAFTKSALKKALKKHYITVNEVIANSATYIHGGEAIMLAIPEETAPKRKLILPLSVLFEDEHLAAIHKPAGIVVSGNTFKTIANALSQNINQSILPNATAPMPVHRLDYETTGILLIGKTSSAIRDLNQMFENKEITKTYYAIAIGEMKEKAKISSKIDNKESQSNYTLMASVPSKRFGKLNLTQLTPKTGRRHQLRKHLSQIGHPILGDKIYGLDNLILHGKGLYLHAYSLKFIHPYTQEKVSLKDDFPQKFKKIFPHLK